MSCTTVHASCNSNHRDLGRKSHHIATSLTLTPQSSTCILFLSLRLISFFSKWANTKIGGGARKVSFLEYLCPGNSWMPFTFQAALQALQQPHKHSHSLQLAIHTEPSTSLHSICFVSSLCFSFFIEVQIGFLQSTAQPHQSTEMAFERAASHIKLTPLPVYSPCHHEKCKQSNNSN